jgi:superfamily II DNA or RNA helicase
LGNSIPDNSFGRRVRLIGDPTRIGFLAEGARSRGDRTLKKVKFPENTQWVPEDQIELLPEERESPLDLLEMGKLGHSVDLRRTLAHVRLTGRLANVIYSMEATNTDFYAYQFKPVLRFLNTPSNALLIADEVGLGKTIEAGLIWTELRSRYDFRRLLVLCPAMLREKWQRELGHKIGVEAHIVNAKELKKRLEDRMAVSGGFALICSLEGSRPPRGWDQQDGLARSGAAELARLLQSKENDDPLMDLLIIDEAHYLRNPESQTNKLGQLMRAVTASLVLLTATPVHNRNKDLFSLLQLLDRDIFQRVDDLELILSACQPLVCARDQILSRHPSSEKLRATLQEAHGHPLLEDNRQLALIREHLDQDEWLDNRERRAELASRLEMINPLAYVITRTRKRDIKEWRVVRDPVAERIPMTPCEEAFYYRVTDYVVDYAMKRAASERFILATPQRQMASCMPAALQLWLRRGSFLDENTPESSKADPEENNELVPRDPESEAAYVNNPRLLGPLALELATMAQSFGDLDELKRNDSKYLRVSSILKQYFDEHPEEKIVLFSTYRETLNYLYGRLEAEGIKCILLHGGVDESKDDILRRFEDDHETRVLLSSEMGSEGIDLQFCRVLINYDLPWNPMRIEQRIGRLDRIGQKSDRIAIWNLFYENTIDDRIYSRLYDKLELCRKALGDFEAVLGDEIRKLTTDFLSAHLNPKQQEDRIDQTAQAMANLKNVEEHLENEAAHLVAYGDYILNQVHAARDLNRWVTGEDIRTYVIEFFRTHFTGCTFKQVSPDGLDYEIELSSEATFELDNFAQQHRLIGLTKLCYGSYRSVLCRFENVTTGAGRGKMEYISQFHPLVRFVSAKISELEEQLTPAVSVKLSSEDIPAGTFQSGDYLLAAARWSVQGLQAVEQLVFAGARVDVSLTMLSRLDAEQLATLCAKRGTDWYEAPTQLNLKEMAAIANAQLLDSLDEEYDEFVNDMRRRNHDRIDLQKKNLERYLNRQRERLERMLSNHRVLGRNGIAKAVQGQIEHLESRVEQRRLKIEQGRDIKFNKEEILIAIVRVGNEPV